MICALVLALFLSDGPPPPPPDFTPDPALRVKRMEKVRSLILRDARIFVAEGDSRAIELTAPVREEILAVLDRSETYSDIPGVVGCVAEKYVVTVVFRDRTRKSWFCRGCRRIMPMWIEEDGLDAILSEGGAEEVERLLARTVHQKNAPPKRGAD